jgi:hypothetical protein
MSEQQVEQQATAQAAAPAEGQAPEAPATPDLTVQDLQALKMIIDVASQRGTFRANEMTSVGQVYNRLTAFLDHIAPQAKEGAAAPEAPKQ